MKPTAGTGRNGKGRNPEFVRQVTEAILIHPDITATQARVLGFLWSRYGDADGRMWPALKTVSRYFDLHERVIRGHIDKLCETDLLTKAERTHQRNGRFGSNVLVLNVQELLSMFSNAEERVSEQPSDERLNVHPRPVVVPLPAADHQPSASDQPSDTHQPTDQRLMASRSEPGKRNQGEATDAVEASDAVAQDARASNESDFVRVLEDGQVGITHPGLAGLIQGFGLAGAKRMNKLVSYLHEHDRLGEFDAATSSIPNHPRTIYEVLEPMCESMGLDAHKVVG